MIGGEREVFTTMLPLFQCMGEHVVYQGPTESDQYTKMCNQIATASVMIGVCEVQAYAENLGWIARQSSRASNMCRRPLVIIQPWAAHPQERLCARLICQSFSLRYADSAGIYQSLGAAGSRFAVGRAIVCKMSCLRGRRVGDSGAVAFAQ